MKKIYEVNLKFEAQIDCSLPECGDEDYIALSPIKSFLSAFVTHTKEMEIYYKNYFIDTFLLDCDELESIKELLGYQKDFKNLFCSVAEECNPDVKDFIHHVYKAGNSQNQRAINIEAVRELLDNQFGPLTVLAAEFKEKVSATDNHV